MMSKVGSWSTTPGSNNSTPPDGWPEGQAPSTVNDCAREMMAQIRTLINDAQFIDQNLTPTYISATSFSVAGDQTSAIHAGRRLKIFDATAGATTTIYATVVTASYTTVTTITVTNDAGQLTSSLSSFAIAIISVTNSSLPKDLSLSSLGVSTLTIPGTLTVSGAVSLLTTLSVSGATALRGNLSVGGTSLLTGAVRCDSTLSVSGVAYTKTILVNRTSDNGSDKLQVNGNALFNNDGVSGNLGSMGIDKSVGGNARIVGYDSAGAFNILIDAGGPSTLGGGGLSVNGALATATTLSVSGATVLKGTLNVEGATSLSGAVALGTTLSVSGATVLKGALSVGGAVNLASTLTVGGALAVSGAVRLDGTLSVSGTVVAANTAKVWASLSMGGAGATPAILSSFNVSAVTRVSSGVFQLALITPLATSAFAISVISSQLGVGALQAAGSNTLAIVEFSFYNTNTQVLLDPGNTTRASVLVFA